MQIYGLSDALLSQQSRKLFTENERFRVGELKYSNKLKNDLL